MKAISTFIVLEINQNHKKKHKSFASEATKSRLDILNANRKDIIGVEIIDLEDKSGLGIGTKVVVNIPFNIDL